VYRLSEDREVEDHEQRNDVETEQHIILFDALVEDDFHLAFEHQLDVFVSLEQVTMEALRKLSSQLPKEQSVH